ncbi:MAG TPA: cupin domain-containing protein [Gaiellaceae bacterium]|nr:cupin domain-containing protein [Gaiellaceae bacterium]
MSAFSKLEDIKPQQIWDGLIARSLHGEKSSLTQIELEPNIDVPEHAHENEQIGILTAGSMTFTIGGETREVQPGDGWVIPANVPHSVSSGPEGAALIELFAPPRHDWAKHPWLETRPPRLS